MTRDLTSGVKSDAPVLPAETARGDVAEAVDRVSRFCIDWKKGQKDDFGLIISTSVENTVDLWVEDLQKLIRAAQREVPGEVVDDVRMSLWKLLVAARKGEAIATAHFSKMKHDDVGLNVYMLTIDSMREAIEEGEKALSIISGKEG